MTLKTKDHAHGMQEESDSDWDSIVEPLPQPHPESVAKKTSAESTPPEKPASPMDSDNKEFEEKQARNLLNLAPTIQPHLAPPSPQLPRSTMAASLRSTDLPKLHDVPPMEGSLPQGSPPFVQVDICPPDDEAKATKAGGLPEPMWKPHNPFITPNGNDKPSSSGKIFEKRWMYVFDHGKYSQFDVCDEPNDSCITSSTDKFDDLVHRIWAKAFASLRFVLDFVILFVLHLLRFVARDVFQPLFLGSCLIACDYVLKPTLTVAFNSVIQPTFVFFWNTTSSLVRVLQPFIDILFHFINLLATLVRAFRLVEVHLPPPANPKSTV